VEWNVPVTSPQGSLLTWYETKADPEDWNNLIVCGTRRNSQDNAYYGVVYSSHDGGKSWKIALEDRGSAWVTEHSCAFGSRHMAYFISEASKVVDGEPHHDLGTTRVFVSSDAGETWVETAETGWADFSSSVVAGPRDSGARQLYVFYNGEAESDGAKKLGSTLEFFTVSEDGKKMSRRRTVAGMAEKDYLGVYPSSSVVLRDGSPIVLYDGGKNPIAMNGSIFVELGVVRFTSNHPSAPIKVASPTWRFEPPICPASLSNSLAYDEIRDVLYLAYNDATSGHCGLMLTNSHDGGRTWSVPRELRPAEDSQSPMYFPVMAVNREGIIGLLWRGRPGTSPGCWNFSISRDGLNLDGTVPLSACHSEDFLRSQSSGYLETIIQQPKAGKPASVELLTRRDYLQRVGVTATPDGVFHPVWSTSGDGFGELRTARIRTGNVSHPLSVQPAGTTALTDVTDKIIVLYGGEQRLDHETNSVMLDVSFRNNGSVPIRAPLYGKAEISSDFGKIEIVNPVFPTTLGAGYFDLSSSLRKGLLAPGETTSPYHLTFHFTNESTEVPNRYFILEMKLRLLCEQ
jgi:hypothetical protein